jgi:hypothetical protein
MTALILRSWQDITQAMDRYRVLAQTQPEEEPPLMSGHLKISGKRMLSSQRHFRCETGTPLLVHTRSKTQLEGDAIDLMFASKIFVVSTTNRFVIQVRVFLASI